MIVPFYVYAVATGEILRAGSVSDRFLPSYSTGSQEVVSGVQANPETQYHDLNLNALTDKTDMPTPGKTTVGFQVTFSPVPRPCVVIVDGDATTVSDGSAEINFGGAGTYRVRIEAAPYLPYSTEVTV